MFPGAQPGEIVLYEDISWIVTPQGHLEADVPDPAQGDGVSEMLECNVAAEQRDPIVE